MTKKTNGKYSTEDNGEHRFESRTYNVDGEFPILPISAFTKEGRISDMVPGHYKFVYNSSVVYDYNTRKIMVDINEVLPENQEADDRMAVMRIIQTIGGRAIDGYVVDCRRNLPYGTDRFDDDGNIYKEVIERYNPVPALGIVAMDRLTKKPQYIGQPEAENAAGQLVSEIDKALNAVKMKAKKKATKRARKLSKSTSIDEWGYAEFEGEE